MARRQAGDRSGGPGERAPGWRRALGLGAMLAGVAGATAVIVSRRRGGGGSNEGPPGPDSRSLSAGYETHDISAAGLAKILVGFSGTVIVAVAVMFWMIGFFVSREIESRPPFTPQEQAQIVPPGPHLQVEPFADIRALHRREDRLLRGYAWLGPDHKLARIPIDRAMALVAGRPFDPSPQGRTPASPALPR